MYAVQSDTMRVVVAVLSVPGGCTTCVSGMSISDDMSALPLATLQKTAVFSREWAGIQAACARVHIDSP